VRDVAAQVPYDIIMIMVNSKRYGGGGFYGQYSDFTADGTWNDYVFLHEFGHAFAGLGDEYYASEVPTSDFYPDGVEPTDPNLTALLDASSLKWKDLLSPGLAVPTEWGQARFDSLRALRDTLAKERAEKVRLLTSSGATEEQVLKVKTEFDTRFKALGEEIVAFLEKHPLRGKIGVFQGGGYRSKGIYRPTVNSIMHEFNKSDRDFFGVSERAILRMIDYYGE
jgi:hypothetical protein